MRKHYDGEALKERLEDTGLSKKEMIDSAGIGKYAPEFARFPTEYGV
jgi:hypothetical protein